MLNFMNMLQSRWIEGKNVCVGLDSDYDRLPDPAKRSQVPEDAVFEFNRSIILSVGFEVCAFKPNIAFYSRKDSNLRRSLSRTCSYIRNMCPGVPIILDSKRADIGNTNVGYAIEAFDEFDADAVTVNPYLGSEALSPFLHRKDKGIIVLCRTSNPGAKEFQDRRIFIGDLAEIRDLTDKDVPRSSDGETSEWELPGQYGWYIPLYQYVAMRVARYWNENGNCALVVGATAPHELKTIRYLVGDMPILVPGVGAQGGDLESVVRNGLTRKGGLIINASRSVIFAARDHTYPAAARAEVDRMNSVINTIRVNT